MIIQSIELREIRLPLIHFFETSFGRTTERRILMARLADANGVEGWGECTAGEEPFYSGRMDGNSLDHTAGVPWPDGPGTADRKRCSCIFSDEACARSSHGQGHIIEPPVRVSARGTIKAPESPGLGFAINLPRIEALTVRKETIK